MQQCLITAQTFDDAIVKYSSEYCFGELDVKGLDDFKTKSKDERSTTTLELAKKIITVNSAKLVKAMYVETDETDTQTGMPSERTLLKWYSQFIQYGGLKEDCRGKWIRDNVFKMFPSVLAELALFVKKQSM